MEQYAHLWDYVEELRNSDKLNTVALHVLTDGKSAKAFH